MLSVKPKLFNIYAALRNDMGSSLDVYILNKGKEPAGNLRRNVLAVQFIFQFSSLSLSENSVFVDNIPY